MSTRAVIAVTDNPRGGHVFFYRHMNGYPKGVARTLDKFCAYQREERIRSNPTQASGWLVILGHREIKEDGAVEPESSDEEAWDWKCGSYEPTSDDALTWINVEHVHVVNIKKGAWHPVETDKHPKLAEALSQHAKAHSAMYYAARKEGARDQLAARMNETKSELKAAFHEAIGTVHKQLESGELASWVRPAAEPEAGRSAAPAAGLSP